MHKKCIKIRTEGDKIILYIDLLHGEVTINIANIGNNTVLSSHMVYTPKGGTISIAKNPEPGLTSKQNDILAAHQMLTIALEGLGAHW